VQESSLEGPMKLILDAHLDLSWNALSYDRDQLLSIDELRAAEAGMTGKSRGNCTVSLPEMRRGGVAVCLATLLCRALPGSLPEMDDNLGSTGQRRHGEVILREDLDYANQSIACAAAQGQLAYYRLLEAQGHIRMIRDALALDGLWAQWEQGHGDAGVPIGYILSMEGADPIVEPEQAAWWWQQGLRTVCLAHYGPSAYAMGTGGDGPLTPLGRELLKEFERLGMILDLVHTADTALSQALEIYSGPVFISHGNCRALVPHDRQISDEQIRQVVARGGVIGAVLDAWMLAPDYHRDDPNRPQPTLAHVADHIDHVCQLAGNARHSAIGSDLDGGFGTEQSPTDLDTIADMQKLEGILAGRGYSDIDIDGIFHGNWLRFFREALPR
jgi:membrane dipeptidase